MLEKCFPFCCPWTAGSGESGTSLCPAVSRGHFCPSEESCLTSPSLLARARFQATPSLPFFTMVCPSTVQGPPSTLQVGRLRHKGARVSLKPCSWKMAKQNLSLVLSDSGSPQSYSFLFLYPVTFFDGHCAGFLGQGAKAEMAEKVALAVGTEPYSQLLVLGSGEPMGMTISLEIANLQTPGPYAAHSGISHYYQLLLRFPCSGRMTRKKEKA